MTRSETVNKILKIKENKIQAYVSEKNPASERADYKEEAVLNEFTQICFLPVEFSAGGVFKKEKTP